MSRFDELRARVLKDRRITPDEVAVISSHVKADGQLDLQDVKVLIELQSEAEDVCPEFDDLFFPVLRSALLEDGKILADEQYYLLKMLYSDGRVREQECRFLRELQREVEPSPEFDQLCKTAFASAESGWALGGRT